VSNRADTATTVAAVDPSYFSLILGLYYGIAETETPFFQTNVNYVSRGNYFLGLTITLIGLYSFPIGLNMSLAGPVTSD